MRRITPALVLLALAFHGGIALGEPVTPSSIASIPTPILAPVHGTDVPDGGFVTDQYVSAGLSFQREAIGVVNGQLAWIPTGDNYGIPTPSEPNQVNFYPGFHGVITGNFVTPAGEQGIVDWVSIEFAGIPESGANVVATKHDNGPFADPSLTIPDEYSTGVGPNGGFLVTIKNAQGIKQFDAYKYLTPFETDFTKPSPWGIASIEFGPVQWVLDKFPQEVVSAPSVPEPTTLMLASVGLGLGLLRRRARSASTK